MAPTGTHWDFMLEMPGQDGLLTWRLQCNPLEAAEAIAIEPLGPHRRAYLDYEGPLSGGRGVVRRLDRGPATIERGDAAELVVLLEGARLRGRFVLRAGAWAQLT